MPPPQGGLAALARDRAVRRRGAGARGGDGCWRRRTSSTAASCWAWPTVPEQDWVRLTQSQFAPVEITPEFWIVPTWHEPPAAGAAGDPARPGPGLRHRHASDHAHVPALDRDARGSRPASACWTTAAAPASWRSARPSSAPREIDAVDIDPAAVESTRAQRRRPTACSCSAGLPELAPGPLRHSCWPTSSPRRSSCWRRCCARTWRPAAPGAGRHPRAPGRRAEAAYAPWLRARGRATARTAGS